jgi:hypothetical protein
MTAKTPYIGIFFTEKIKKCCLAVMYICTAIDFEMTAVTPLILSVFVLLLIFEKNKTATKCTNMYIVGG